MVARFPIDDPEAFSRIEKLLDCPSYRMAEDDVEFLFQNETRGVRLQLDFFKAETLLAKFGIEQTIVTYGSARTLDPETAAQQLADLKSQADELDGNYTQRLREAEKDLIKSAHYTQARQFGQIVGRSGKGPSDCRLTLVTGGGPGIMEAANRGAFDVGAKSVGLNIDLPHEQYPNAYVSPELCFRFHYFAMRKLHFIMRAKALVAFPGGFGTMDELFDLLTLSQTGKIAPVPIILVDKKFWQKAINLDYLVAEGFINEQDKELVIYAETAVEIWQSILAWYKGIGECLIIDN